MIIIKKLHDKSSKNNDELQNVIYKLNKVHNMLYEFTTYLNSSEISAVNNPYILLYGEGGIGKSHIIADTIMKRNSEGKQIFAFFRTAFQRE